MLKIEREQEIMELLRSFVCAAAESAVVYK